MIDMKLTDFEPEKIQAKEAEKAEDQKVIDLLGRFTAHMLMEALRNEGGHPKPEWGDGETWRFYYIDECRRRGTRLLEQLGWPTDENAEYVNLHTGSIRTLLDVATNCGYFSDRHTIASQIWSVIEDWEPYNPENPNQHLIDYLEDELSRLRKLKRRGNLNAYEKSDVKKIREYEEKIANEKIKPAKQWIKERQKEGYL